MRRSLWAVYWLVAVVWFLGLGLFSFGSVIEGRVSPVRIDHSVSEVTRIGERVCWSWSSTKVRNVVSDDIDVYLFVGDDRASTYVFRESDGTLWSRAAATTVGRTVQRWCTRLPPSVHDSIAARVEWRAWYPGYRGWWRIPLRLPDVVIPPEV